MSQPIELAEIRDRLEGSLLGLMRRLPVDLRRLILDQKGPKEPGGRLTICYLYVADAPTLASIVSDPAYREQVALLKDSSIEVRAVNLEETNLVRIPPDQHGLMYLKNPFPVAADKRYSELYGWDTRFIVDGFLTVGSPEALAAARDSCRAQAELVDMIGFVPNSNRTNQADRFQQPFLAGMVRRYFDASSDTSIITELYDSLEKQYNVLTAEFVVPSGPAAGLYYYGTRDKGTPCLEVIYGEVDDDGHTHYDRARGVFANLASQGEDVSPWYRDGQLTPDYYVGDRAMRGSGFDISDRFGWWGCDSAKIAPVCLNSLMYAYSMDMAYLAKHGGHAHDVPEWTSRAEKLKTRMNEVMWTELPDGTGAFLDFNFRTSQKVDYCYATDFYPLTFGLATPEQATKIVRRSFPKLFTPRGLLTSITKSGHQWDAPYGWMPLQVLAVEGLQHYDFASEAQAIIKANVSFLIDSGGKSDEKRNLLDADPERVELVSGYEENVPMIGFSTGSYLWLMKQAE